MSANDVFELINIDGAVFIDVREPFEFAIEHISGSHNVPINSLVATLNANTMAMLRSCTNQLVVVLCQRGNRSAEAVKVLQTHAIDAVSLIGGLDEWCASGFPTQSSSTLTLDQRRRYDRQIRLKNLGAIGQERLLSSRVAIVGVGGLGSPVALYLAAAGVGNITIIDNDHVDISNLHRQILYGDRDLELLKVDVASTSLSENNRDTCVTAICDRVVDENAIDLLQRHDVIVDASDNITTRYAINTAAVSLNIPVVHGSVFRFEGTVSVFDPPSGPCYECLYPKSPSSAIAPNCAEVGVLGSVVGIIGSMQATEAIKIITESGEPLVGRLVTYDALYNSLITYEVARDTSCPTCSDK